MPSAPAPTHRDSVSDKAGTILLLFAYRLLLDLLFVWYLAPYWGYMGYGVDINVANFSLSILQLAIIGFLMPARFNRPSDLVFCFYIALVLLPFQTYSSFAGGPFAQMWAAFIAAIPLYLVTTTPLVRFPILRNGPLYFSMLAYAGIAVCLAYAVAQGGLRQFNLDPTRVYDFREAQKELIQSGLAAYLANWVFKILVPFLIVIRLSKRDYASVLLLLVTAVLFFGMSNHKTTIVFPLLVIGLYFTLNRRPRTTTIIAGFAFLFLACAALGWLFDMHYLAGLLFRRAVFAAALNFADYQIFFTDRGFVFWTNSVFSGLADYIYWDSPGRVIGDWRGTFSNANSGFIASGYMHAGWLGVMVYSVLAALYLKILDSVSYTGSLATVGAAIAAPMLHVFLNVDFLIGLSTHGLGVLVLASFLAFSERNSMGRSVGQ